VGKTKIMNCGTELDLLQSSGEFPSVAYHTGVGRNSIFAMDANTGCTKSSGLKHLKEDLKYMY